MTRLDLSELRRARLLGAAGSTALAVGGLTAGALPLDAGYYLGPRTGSAPAGMVCAFAGLAMLLGAWLVLGRSLTAPGAVRELRRTLLVWAAPLLLAPPLFSRDVYSYLAQGTMVRNGIDAYRSGPAMLGDNPLVAQVHPLWLHTPAPYGPVFLTLAAGIVTVTGTHLALGVLGMRLLAVAGVAVLAWALPRLARRDPGTALWLGVLNPLVLMHLVGGAHNDALMVAALVAGLLAARSGRPVLAVALITLAALVKVPAAVAVVFLVPSWRAGFRPVAGRTALVALVAVGTATVVTVGTGLGLGWTHALGTPTIVHNGLSVSTDLGHFIPWVGRRFGLHANVSRTVDATRLAGVALAVAAGLAAWLRRERLGVPLATGVTLSAIVLLGPVVHPWYALWGLVPLAAGAPGPRVRRAAVALTVVLSLVLLPHGLGFTPAGALQALGGLLLGGAALAGWALSGRGVEESGQVAERQPVPVQPQPADHAGGDRGDHRVVPELLPGVDVGDVHLDQRGAEHGAGVAHGV